MQCANEVHYLKEKVSFLNPYMGVQGEYQTPLIIAIWRPGAVPSAPPRWEASPATEPPRQGHGSLRDPADRLRLRRCRVCRAWRLLPRHQVDEPVDGEFECRLLHDERRASCAAGHVVCSWT